MRAFILAAILSVTNCARLESQYLPPNRRTITKTIEGSFSGELSKISSGLNLPKLSSSGISTQSQPLKKIEMIPILKLAADNNGDGAYRTNYETGNGITAEEQGEAREDGSRARGSFTYTSPEGEQISISYTADENGFIPQGSHIPAIPEPIMKSLEIIAAAEARGELDDGQYHGEGLSDGQYRAEAHEYKAAVTSYGNAVSVSATGGYKY